jgi:hypothetical protein
MKKLKKSLFFSSYMPATPPRRRTCADPVC